MDRFSSSRPLWAGFAGLSFARRSKATPRRRFALLGAGFALALSGCASGDGAATGVYRFFNSDRNPELQTAEATAQYTVVPASRAMVHAPQALVVLERNLGGAVEQRIVLPNDTATSGDNVLHLRAQTSRSLRSQTLDFNEIVARFGSLPTPFTGLNPAGMMSATDQLGAFSYAQQSMGGSTVCVLVLRRVQPGARPLPRGTVALDMVMRNCAAGGLEAALAPMRAQSLAISAAPQAAVYTASPFAAPGQ